MMGVTADQDSAENPPSDPANFQLQGLSVEIKSELIEIFNSLIGILEAINANVC